MAPTPHFMSPTAAASAKAGPSSTPAKTKKKTTTTKTTKTSSGGGGGGSVPHFMSPTAAAGGAKTKSKTRSGARPATTGANPKKPAGKTKTRTKAPTTGDTGATTMGLAATIVPSRKKPTIADPTAPLFRKPGPSADLALFQSTFAPLIDLGDPQAKKGRAAAWKIADPNGNGILSLAEADKWVLTALVAKHRPFKGRQLHKLYRPSYLLAFDAAKSLGQEGDGNDDYVTKKEFRLFIAYLSLHADLLDAFAAIDGGGVGVTKKDDRRISRDEWIKGHHTVSTYDWVGLRKLTDAEAEAVFDKMDGNGGGFVLLKEWCDYLIRAEVNAGTEA